MPICFWPAPKMPGCSYALLSLTPAVGAQSNGRALADNALLTDHEGTLLALIDREQPLTAYQVTRIYERSPVSNLSGSTGKIYPLIRRLKTRGYLEAKIVDGDARRTEQLSATDAGRAALREWIRVIRPEHLLLEDPLRTRLSSFYLLTREEQLEYVQAVKAELGRKLAEVESYDRRVDLPLQTLVVDNAVSSLRSRLDWIDRVLVHTFSN